MFIMRAGEVIPEVVSVLTELRNGTEKEIFPLEKCPICGTHLEQEEGKVAIFCPNSHCPAKIQGQLEMFVSKQALNIDGLGARQIELFLELGWITDFLSIFSLKNYREKLLMLEGYKEKSVNNLLSSIENAKKTTLDRVFVALGIPNVKDAIQKPIPREQNFDPSDPLIVAQRLAQEASDEAAAAAAAAAQAASDEAAAAAQAAGAAGLDVSADGAAVY